ncbi:MAG: type I 3-dehydroquinate dehydratase [Thermocrinis sp.]|jgi:3-dehydroquinate dehydratase-1|nr:type I 3-dehydroquinate dehydratase [Thermocrinis sp.]
MLIAVPLTDKNFEEDAKAIKDLGADAVEVRVDLFEDKSPERVLWCLQKAKSLGLLTILTIRSPQEGGKEVPNRKELFERACPHSDYTDIELSSQDLLPFVRDLVKSSGKKLIISYHNFELTPANWILREVFRQARRWSADIVKVAVKANSYQDTARLLCLCEKEEGEKVIIAMGKYGKISRLAGYIFGSVISYAFYRSATAEGQLSLEEMVRLKREFYS